MREEQGVLSGESEPGMAAAKKYAAAIREETVADVRSMTADNSAAARLPEQPRPHIPPRITVRNRLSPECASRPDNTGRHLIEFGGDRLEA